MVKEYCGRKKIFVEEVYRQMGYKVKGRKVIQMEELYLIKEPDFSYSPFFKVKNVPLIVESTYLWNLTVQ